MRGTARVALLLLVLLQPFVGLAPSAGAEIVIENNPPLRPSVPGYPHLSCTIVFDTDGRAECETVGVVGAVNEITVRTSRYVTSVRVFVDNLDTQRQVAFFDCPPTCTVTFPSQSGTFRLYMVAEADAGATVSVWIARDTVGLP